MDLLAAAGQAFPDPEPAWEYAIVFGVFALISLVFLLKGKSQDVRATGFLGFVCMTGLALIGPTACNGSMAY